MGRVAGSEYRDAEAHIRLALGSAILPGAKKARAGNRAQKASICGPDGPTTGRLVGRQASDFQCAQAAPVRKSSGSVVDSDGRGSGDGAKSMRGIWSLAIGRLDGLVEE